MKHRSSLIRMPFILIICLLLVACTNNPFQSSTGGQTPTAQNTTLGNTPISEVVTQPVPPTQTDCPANGEVRPMVTAPLALGKNPQIIYIPDDGDEQTFPRRVVRYDTVAHTSTDIVNLPENESISDVTLSADRQWLLMRVHPKSDVPSRDAQVRVVRVDGQGMQTLFCTYNGSLTWSPDGRWVGYTLPIQYPGSADKFYLVDITTGKEHIAVDIPPAAKPVDTHNPRPTLWLSNNQVYLTDIGGGASINTYLLDVNKGENQALGTLPVVTQQPHRNAVADGTHLFLNVSECSNGRETCANEFVTNSSIMRLPAQGGTAETIFQQDSLIIKNFTLAKEGYLLVFTDNVTEGKRETWMVNTDGSNPVPIASAPASSTILDQTGNFINSQPSWSIMSPKGKYFLAPSWPVEGGEDVQLAYGTMQEGLMKFLPESSRLTRAIGWTLL